MHDSSKKLGKLQITESSLTENSSDTVEAIFKVRQPNYIPEGVQLRARIDATMFTGTVQSCEVNRVQSDQYVESVEVSSRLQIIE